MVESLWATGNVGDLNTHVAVRRLQQNDLFWEIALTWGRGRLQGAPTLERGAMSYQSAP